MAKQPRYLNYWLADVNGNTEINGDYSSIPVNFFYTPPSDVAYTEIWRLMGGLSDTTLSGAKYGNLSALSTGIEVKTETQQFGELILADSIKTNNDWSFLCYDTLPPFPTTLPIRWTFGKAGLPLVLHQGEYFVITPYDNMSGINNHGFRIQGYEYF